MGVIIRIMFDGKRNFDGVISRSVFGVISITAYRVIRTFVAVISKPIYKVVRPFDRVISRTIYEIFRTFLGSTENP